MSLPQTPQVDAAGGTVIRDAETPSVSEQPQWELSKENFVPLKSGRRTSALQEVTAEPAQSASKQALETRRR